MAIGGAVGAALAGAGGGGAQQGLFVGALLRCVFVYCVYFVMGTQQSVSQCMSVSIEGLDANTPP